MPTRRTAPVLDSVGACRSSSTIRARLARRTSAGTWLDRPSAVIMTMLCVPWSAGGEAAVEHQAATDRERTRVAGQEECPLRDLGRVGDPHDRRPGRLLRGGPGRIDAGGT